MSCREMNEKVACPFLERPHSCTVMFFGARLGCIPSGDEFKEVTCPFLERSHSCYILLHRARLVQPGRPGLPGRPGRPGRPRRPRQPGRPGRPGRPGQPGRPREPARPRRWVVFRVGMNKIGGLFAPGEAPFLYHVMLFGCKAGLYSVWRWIKKVACLFLEGPHSCIV